LRSRCIALDRIAATWVWLLLRATGPESSQAGSPPRVASARCSVPGALRSGRFVPHGTIRERFCCGIPLSGFRIAAERNAHKSSTNSARNELPSFSSHRIPPAHKRAHKPHKGCRGDQVLRVFQRGVIDLEVSEAKGRPAETTVASYGRSFREALTPIKPPANGYPASLVRRGSL